MHYFIYPTADSWISSGSSHITDESFRGQNFGQDEILEYKIFGNKGHILFDVIKGVASLHNKDGVLENRLEKSVGASIGSQDFWALSYPEHATSENLVNIILNKDVNRSPGSLGLQVVKLLVAAYRSTQENKLIEIN